MHILVIGGYGNFGKRLVQSLSQNYGYKITIAGRNLRKAQALCKALSKSSSNTLHSAYCDIHRNFTQLLNTIKPNIVVNAVGPFQSQLGEYDYAVARACIQAQCHYVDLADARGFVNSFSNTLNSEAQKAGVMLVTGASTVPGLSTAVIEHYKTEFKTLSYIKYGISPGNRIERGLATVHSILTYTGKPFTTIKNGKPNTIFGWQGLELFDFGQPLDKRWLSHCDIPDLDLLPNLYPSLQNIEFKAGLEVTLLHVGLWLLSSLPRLGIIKNLAFFSKHLTQASEWFKHFGSDKGGMDVQLSGVDTQGNKKIIRWQLIAEQGSGPNVPTIAAELVIKHMASGQIKPGAQPCVQLFSLQEFMQVANRWGIYQREVQP